MDTTLASYFAARDARTRAAMMLFKPISRQSRKLARNGGAMFEASLGCLMLASLAMIGSQAVGVALLMLGCVFFFFGMEMLTRAGSLADGQIAVCFEVIDSEKYHPEFIATMKKHVQQRIEEEWDPIFG